MSGSVASRNGKWGDWVYELEFSLQEIFFVKIVNLISTSNYPMICSILLIGARCTLFMGTFMSGLMASSIEKE